MRHFTQVRVLSSGILRNVNTTLQAGRSRVRDPMKCMKFLNLPNPSSRIRFTQPLTEMSTRSRKIMFLGNRMRSVRRTDSNTAICEPIV
jgi:hypothetical protein